MSDDAQPWPGLAQPARRPARRRRAGPVPLDALLRALWHHRGRMLLAMLLTAALGATPILLWPRAYVAEVTVAPAETTGIAASSLLAPVSLSPGSLLDSRPSGNFAIYLAAMRSTEAARMLLAETPLLDHLAARREASPLAPLRRLLGLDRPADFDDAKLWLEANLAVTANLTTVTWEINLPHPDRAFALDALRRLHRFAEAKVRDDIAGIAARRIALLTQRLATERDLFLRNGLTELLAQQQRAAMVAAAEEAVAARLVSAPSVEFRPSTPNRPLLLGLLLIASLALVTLGTAALALMGALAWPE